MRLTRALPGFLAAISVVSSLLSAPQVLAAPANQIGSGSKYVAIGDSFAAVGSLTQMDRVSRNALCGFSKDNYAQQLASMMGLNLTDVTCGFARTDEYWNSQTHPVPMPDRGPQRLAITPDTDLVTITLGGNDMGGVESLFSCLGRYAVGNVGPTCRELADSSLKTRLNGLQQKLEGIYRDAHQQAPHAKIVAVGYLKPVVANQPRCENYGNFPTEDLQYIEFALERLNGIVAAAAKNTGTIYVAPHNDNGSCAPKGQRTTSVLGLPDDALAAHPTAHGHRVLAESVRDAVK